jgi:hypothetical protein
MSTLVTVPPSYVNFKISFADVIVKDKYDIPRKSKFSCNVVSPVLTVPPTATVPVPLPLMIQPPNSNYFTN